MHATKVYGYGISLAFCLGLGNKNLTITSVADNTTKTALSPQVTGTANTTLSGLTEYDCFCMVLYS